MGARNQNLHLQQTEMDARANTRPNDTTRVPVTCTPIYPSPVTVYPSPVHPHSHNCRRRRRRRRQPGSRKAPKSTTLSSRGRGSPRPSMRFAALLYRFFGGPIPGNLSFPSLTSPSLGALRPEPNPRSTPTTSQSLNLFIICIRAAVHSPESPRLLAFLTPRLESRNL